MPKFFIHEPEYLGDEPLLSVCPTIYDAAEEYARWRNSNENALLERDFIEVEIEDAKGNRTRFRLIAEQSVSYTCRVVEPKTAAQP